jgi:hypothetical protein
VLRDPEVVERDGQHDRVGGKQFVDQCRRQRDGRLLLRGAGVGSHPVAGHCLRPHIGAQHVDADVPPLDGVVGMGGHPFGFHHIGDLAARRALGTDAGIKTEQGHVDLQETSMLK